MTFGRILSRQRPGLRLLVAAEAETADGFERGFEAPSLVARPADRCEPWPVADPTALRSLAVAAADHGVAVRLAAVVVVERALLSVELAPRGLDELARQLDAEAARARVIVELSDGLSAYLKALAGRDHARSAGLPGALPLPMRLNERIVARLGHPRLEVALLASALAWERAAVLEGRTMSEWAALTTLELSG